MAASVAAVTRLFPWLMTLLLLLCGLGDRASAKALCPENIASRGFQGTAWECVLNIEPQAIESQWDETALQPGMALDVCNGPNVYTYVRQNPWTKYDALGLWESGSYWGDVWNVYKGYGNAAVNTVKGIVTVVAHPVQTAQGIGQAIAHPIDTGKAIVNDIGTKLETNEGAGEVIGDVLIGVATGGATKAVAESGTVAKLVGKLEKVAGKLDDAGDVGKALTTTAREVAEEGGKTADVAADAPKAAPGTYAPLEPLPRNPNGTPMPDPAANGPHSQIGTKQGTKGPYTQAREFDADGNPVRDIDFTDHGRPQNHPNPHQHRYVPNETGGTLRRSKKAEPLE